MGAIRCACKPPAESSRHLRPCHDESVLRKSWVECAAETKVTQVMDFLEKEEEIGVRRCHRQPQSIGGHYASTIEDAGGRACGA
jgi:hypothetical protein